MAEMRIFVENAPGTSLSTSGSSAPGTASYVKVTDGTNTVAVDSGGRITTNAVAQVAQNQYTEATTSRTTSGNTAGGSWTANVQQAFVGVNVTAFTGGTSPTLVVQLQQQDANGNFQTIGASQSITATGMYAFSVGTGMTSGQMIMAGQGQYRLAWVVTGTPATLSFQLGLSAR